MERVERPERGITESQREPLPPGRYAASHSRSARRSGQQGCTTKDNSHSAGLDRPTFFTLDGDFNDRRLCHERYCLVYLNVAEETVAEYVRRLLRHRELNSRAKRLAVLFRFSPPVQSTYGEVTGTRKTPSHTVVGTWPSGRFTPNDSMWTRHQELLEKRQPVRPSQEDAFMHDDASVGRRTLIHLHQRREPFAGKFQLVGAVFWVHVAHKAAPGQRRSTASGRTELR